MIFSTSVPSVSAAICAITVSLPVPRSVAPISRLNEPSSLILIVAAPMSISGMLEPCIRHAMPMPRRKRPVFCLQSLRFFQPIAFAPALMQRSSSQLPIACSTPALPSPSAANTGEVSPLRMWFRIRNSRGSMPIASASSSIAQSMPKLDCVAP